MTGPAWDLDAPVEAEAEPAGTRSGLIRVLVVGLVALAAGALAGSVLIRPAQPALPPRAGLTVRDFQVDPSAPADGTGSGSTGAGATGSGQARIGVPVVVLRIQVDNPDPGPVRFTALTVDGVARTRTVLPLDVEVAGGGSTSTDVTARADCSAGREPTPLRAWLTPTGAGPAERDGVPVVTSRSLSLPGGLCSELNTGLPQGWRTPLQAGSTELEAPDLMITIAGLDGSQISGLLVDEQLLPTVYVGDQLLYTSARVRPGEDVRLRLRGPPPCIPFSGTAPIPSTLRLLVESDDGLQQQLVIVGPALTRWLRLDCGRG